MGCHFLLQGIFLTQGSNPGLLHCRQTLYRLSHQGSFFRREGINTDQCEKENKNAHNPTVHTILVGLKKFHVHGWKFKSINQKSPLLAGCHNKNTTDWWLKQQKFTFLTVQRLDLSPILRCQQDWFSLRAKEGSVWLFSLACRLVGL